MFLMQLTVRLMRILCSAISSNYYVDYINLNKSKPLISRDNMQPDITGFRISDKY